MEAAVSVQYADLGIGDTGPVRLPFAISRQPLLLSVGHKRSMRGRTGVRQELSGTVRAALQRRYEMAWMTCSKAGLARETNSGVKGPPVFDDHAGRCIPTILYSLGEV